VSTRSGRHRIGTSASTGRSPEQAVMEYGDQLGSSKKDVVVASIKLKRGGGRPGEQLFSSGRF